MLDAYERRFGSAISQIPIEKRGHPGVMLQAIPNREDWENFRTAVREVWPFWSQQLSIRPSSLILLYASCAYFEYEGGELWPKLAQCVGLDSFSAAQQTKTNAEFAAALRQKHFTLLRHEVANDYVGTAVHLAGVPISFWEDFLRICEWAYWNPDWVQLGADEWAAAISRLAINRARLQRYLLNNRDGASALIKEMIDARRLRNEDDSLTIEALLQATFLRPEYFENSTLTSSFFELQDATSYVDGRCQLIFEYPSHFFIHLPPVRTSALPAKWVVQGIERTARPTADSISIGEHAFGNRLSVKLSGSTTQFQQSLAALSGWGLFDHERDGIHVGKKDTFPLSRYSLVSRRPIDLHSVDGLPLDEIEINEKVFLPNDRPFYVTELPIFQPGRLAFGIDGERIDLSFQLKPKLASKIYYGRRAASAFRSLLDTGVAKVSQLPIVGLVIPTGYFNTTASSLEQTFHVTIDGKAASGGRWQRVTDPYNPEWDFCLWHWGPKPFMKQSRSGSVSTFSDLASLYSSADLHGDRTLAISSAQHGTLLESKIFLDRKLPGTEECFENLPGGCLALFLLAQSPSGMSWQDMHYARRVIDPSGTISYEQLKKYEERGFLVRRGQHWCIASSRAFLGPARLDPSSKQIKLSLDFCGDPSLLWKLYRAARRKHRELELPLIEVIDKKAHVPYLSMSWPNIARRTIEEWLDRNNIIHGHSLWIH